MQRKLLEPRNRLMLCTSAPGPSLAPACWQFLPPSFNLMGCHHYPASCPMPKTRSAIITPFLPLFLFHHHARSILTYKSVSISVPVSLCLCPHPGPCYPNPSIVFCGSFLTVLPYPLGPSSNSYCSKIIFLKNEQLIKVFPYSKHFSGVVDWITAFWNS